MVGSLRKNLAQPPPLQHGRTMRLQDIPHVFPGADVRVRVCSGLFLVTIAHDGKTGNGRHRKLTFAATRAMLSLQ